MAVVRSASLVIASLSIVLAAVPALAEPAKTEPPITPEEERLYDEGTAAARASRWAEARDRFRAAFAIQKRPRIAALLGRVELELGEHRDAATHLAYFLREETSIGAEDRRQAEELLARASSKVATVVVKVDPVGARVRIDGSEVDAAALAGAVYVDPGARGIEVEGANGGRARVDLQAPAGSKHEVTISLREGRAPGVKAMSGGQRWGIAGVGLVASLAGVSTGVALWMVARDQPTEYAARAYDRGSLGAFVAGGALGLGTAMFALVTGPSDASEAKVAAGPWVLPGGAGFGVSGAF